MAPRFCDLLVPNLRVKKTKPCRWSHLGAGPHFKALLNCYICYTSLVTDDELLQFGKTARGMCSRGTSQHKKPLDKCSQFSCLPFVTYVL